MGGTNSILRPILIVVLLALPAVILKIASNYYDYPYLQPLDLTVEGLAKVGEGPEAGKSRIDVDINWGRDFDGRMTRAGLQSVIANSLESQTSYYRFNFRDAPGGQVEVRFRVKGNSYGPYAPGGMVRGIDAALMVLQMTNGPDR
ncbi:hypothetical protein RXV86_18770 [Alisedimentitalea sp. MJ-SS2]|uniref:hypothetical protein n=1 Tax=Aliisedimentitalea sp. MJ-SS2 TaxID=3049795 RepID=UPI002907360E|nr:hypothetical protein [Alisedimentitalea sp. MJ-SS2]MDU8929436.1 hypothetical protein [Alisedimentitalea sp. MJ-SS2]